jgi:hypothetical protein
MRRHRQAQGARSCADWRPERPFPQRSAATLLDVVNFYDQRFSIGFTAQQKSDLVAFLNSL